MTAARRDDAAAAAFLASLRPDWNYGHVAMALARPGSGHEGWRQVVLAAVELALYAPGGRPDHLLAERLPGRPG